MADHASHTSRLAAFKANTKGTQDLRRKRVEQSVVLRRTAREDQLQKRRALGSGEEPLSPLGSDPGAGPASPIEVSTEQLPSVQEITSALNTTVRSQQLEGARAARKTLSREQNPPIDLLVNAGCVPRLIQLLECDDCTDLQFESAWALTNIASGTSEQTTFVVEAGAISPLIRLISSPNSAVREQSLWALGNIAGEGAWARDEVLRLGALDPLLRALAPAPPPQASLQRTAVWTLSNLCRNKTPPVDFEAVRPALPTLAQLLHSGDKDVLADSCWALSYLTDGPNERIGAVQDSGVLSALVPLLGHHAPSVQTPALRALGNMVTGSDVQTDMVLEAGALPMLRQLLKSNRASIVKEAAWASCNILAGTQTQIQHFLDADVLPALINVLKHQESRCQREAAWAVTNMTLEGSLMQLAALLSAGALRPYLNLLESPDQRTVIVVLDGLTNLLRRAEILGELEKLCVAIEEDGNLEKLEALQHHQNEEIYSKTLQILDSFFSEDDSKDSGAPDQNNEEYQFNGGGGHIGGF